MKSELTAAFHVVKTNSDNDLIYGLFWGGLVPTTIVGDLTAVKSTTVNKTVSLVSFSQKKSQLLKDLAKI